MDEGDYDQQPHSIIEEVEQFLRGQKPCVITIGENIPDSRPGPDTLAIEKHDWEKGIKGLRNLLDGKEEWQPRKDVLDDLIELGGMENPVPLIAVKREKSQSQIYRIQAELRSLIKNFDRIFIEVKDRLASKFATKRLLVVWRDIMRGETPEEIRLNHGLDKAWVDVAYATIWPIADKVLNEMLNRGKNR